jgi:hypothetical protein
MNKKHIFSLPFPNSMPEKEFTEWFIPFLKEYKEYIYDIYFTSSIPPFLNDAMSVGIMKKEGVVQDPRHETIRVFNLMMGVQEHLGIKVSATYNNTTVEPTQENLDLFIRNLKPLYARGLRSMTIPHYHWMVSGQLRKEFPDMTIKNTILRKVSKPQEYADWCEAGFDVINIDRYNIRDRDNLKKLKKAYDRYKKPMVILVNEWCKGLCPAMDEHYDINNSTNVTGSYFEQPLGCFTCQHWGKNIPHYFLQNANMPMFREDFDEILEYMQVLKLHGRGEESLFKESIDIIKRYARGDEIVLKQMHDGVMRANCDPEKLKSWRVFTKNCKFECWDCHACEDVYRSGGYDGLFFG